MSGIHILMFLKMIDTQIKSTLPFYQDETGTSNLAIYGSSRSGKSTLIMNIIKKYFSDHIIIFFSPNMHADVYLKDQFPNIIFSKYYTPFAIQLAHKLNAATSNAFKFLFILDDVLDVYTSKILSNLVLTYRNARISSIVSLQYNKLIRPGIRANFNQIAYFSYTDRPFLEDLCRTTFGTILGKTKNERIDQYIKLTADHNFLWKNNMQPISDKFIYTLHNIKPLV